MPSEIPTAVCCVAVVRHGYYRTMRSEFLELIWLLDSTGVKLHESRCATFRSAGDAPVRLSVGRVFGVARDKKPDFGRSHCIKLVWNDSMHCVDVSNVFLDRIYRRWTYL